jgi:hypothetical protein
VEVQMGMGLPVVIMRVGMKGEAQGPPDAQEPDRDEQHPDQPFAPGLHETQVQPLLEGYGQGPDGQDPKAVAHAPACAERPRSAAPSDRQGQQRRKVVGPGHHVQSTREQAGSDYEEESEHA